MSELAVRSAGQAVSEEGIKYQPGWILATTATVKVFIGIWAFILGYICKLIPLLAS